MVWKKAHISKIYEALTAIADGRIELISTNKARCFSSSKGKFYEVEFDPQTNGIMSNDNTAYYTDSVSYPMIALLMLKGKITYDQIYEYLQGWFAYAKHANTYTIKKKLLEEMQKTFPGEVASLEINKLLKMQKNTANK